ncbi:hypothetical protein SLE2022_181520 [Rubroshorea leprosula]
MGEWRNDNWCWNFRWKRNLRGRECEDEKKLLEMLEGVRLTKEQGDSRIWKFDSNGLYTSRKACGLMNTGQRILDTDLCRAVWNKLLPRKVCFFAWRMLLDR